MKAASTALILLGLVLIGTSFVWSKIVPKPEPMTEQKEQEYFEAIGDIHTQRKAVSEESKALVNEVYESSQKAARVESMGRNGLRIGGILMTLVGVGIYVWAARQSE